MKELNARNLEWVNSKIKNLKWKKLNTDTVDMGKFNTEMALVPKKLKVEKHYGNYSTEISGKNGYGPSSFYSSQSLDGRNLTANNSNKNYVYPKQIAYKDFSTDIGPYGYFSQIYPLPKNLNTKSKVINKINGNYIYGVNLSPYTHIPTSYSKYLNTRKLQVDRRRSYSYSLSLGSDWRGSQALKSSWWRADRQVPGVYRPNESKSQAWRMKLSQSPVSGTKLKERGVDGSAEYPRRRQLLVNNRAPLRDNGLDASQVGGRLQLFSEEWRRFGSLWLNSVVTDGYMIPASRKPFIPKNLPEFLGLKRKK